MNQLSIVHPTRIDVDQEPPEPVDPKEDEDQFTLPDLPVLIWDEQTPAWKNYLEAGKLLRKSGDIFRLAGHDTGLPYQRSNQLWKFTSAKEFDCIASLEESLNWICPATTWQTGCRGTSK